MIWAVNAQHPREPKLAGVLDDVSETY